MGYSIELLVVAITTISYVVKIICQGVPWIRVTFTSGLCQESIEDVLENHAVKFGPTA